MGDAPLPGGPGSEAGPDLCLLSRANHTGCLESGVRGERSPHPAQRASQSLASTSDGTFLLEAPSPMGEAGVSTAPGVPGRLSPPPEGVDRCPRLVGPPSPRPLPAGHSRGRRTKRRCTRAHDNTPRGERKGSCTTLGKRPSLLGPQFPHLQYGHTHSTDFTEEWSGPSKTRGCQTPLASFTLTSWARGSFTVFVYDNDSHLKHSDSARLQEN